MISADNYAQDFSDALPRAGSGVVRTDPLRFLAGCLTRRLNQALSVLSLSLDFLSVSVVLLTRAPFCVVLFCVVCVFCLLAVLVRLSVVSTTASDELERLVSEMTYNELMGR